MFLFKFVTLPISALQGTYIHCFRLEYQPVTTALTSLAPLHLRSTKTALCHIIYKIGIKKFSVNHSEDSVNIGMFSQKVTTHIILWIMVLWKDRKWLFLFLGQVVSYSRNIFLHLQAFAVPNLIISLSARLNIIGKCNILSNITKRTHFFYRHFQISAHELSKVKLEITMV